MWSTLTMRRMIRVRNDVPLFLGRLSSKCQNIEKAFFAPLRIGTLVDAEHGIPDF
jgi:hypothetical protein